MGSRRINYWPVVAIAALALAILPFQNCTQSSDSSTNSSTGLMNSGNGNGYDGKIFVYVLPTGVCADGKIIDSRIEFRSDQAYLTRDNCTDIAAAQQPAVSVTLHPENLAVITYNGKNYVEWLATYNDVLRAPDGSLYVSGDFMPETFGFRRAFVSKLSSAGAIQWSREITAAGGLDYMSAQKTMVLPNGNLLVLASGMDGNITKGGAYLLEVKANGDLVAQSGFLHPAAEGQRVYFTDIDIAPDGAKVVTGRFTEPGWPMYEDAFVAKLNAANEVQWSTTFRHAYDGWNTNFLMRVALAPGGDVYAAGSLDAISSIVKLNSQGQFQWAKSLSQSPYSYVYFDAGLAVDSSGNAVMSAQSNYKPLLTAFSPSGAVLWARTLSAPMDSSGFIHGLTYLPDGNLVLSGSGMHSGMQSGMTATLSPQLVLGPVTELSRSTDDAFTGRAAPTGDGGIWLTGRTRPPGIRTSIGALVQLRPSTTSRGCPACFTRNDYVFTSVTPTVADAVAPISTTGLVKQNLYPVIWKAIDLYFEPYK